MCYSTLELLPDDDIRQPRRGDGLLSLRETLDRRGQLVGLRRRREGGHESCAGGSDLDRGRHDGGGADQDDLGSGGGLGSGNGPRNEGGVSDDELGAPVKRR